MNKTLHDLITKEFTPLEQAAYQRLLSAERLVDEELFRRQISLREAQCLIDPRLSPYQCVRKFRLSLFTKFDNLSSAVYFGAPASFDPPSWTLRVQGHFPDPAPRAGVFSDVVEKVLVHLPSILTTTTTTQTTPSVYVYTPPERGSGSEDGFELKRVLSSSVPPSAAEQITVEVFLRHGVELLELPGPLARLVGAEVASLPAVYRELCSYIKSKSLMARVLPSLPVAGGGIGGGVATFGSEFFADAVLAEVLQLEAGKQYHLSVLVSQLRALFPWEGRVIKLQVPVASAGPAGTVSQWDILIDGSMADVTATGGRSITLTAEPIEFAHLTRQIAELDRELVSKTDELKRAIDRVKFLGKLKDDVQGVVGELLNSAGTAGAGAGAGAAVSGVGAGFYRQPWAVVAANQIAASNTRR